eukprot:365824-Chlamydomonas_euryale.AAC.4
MQKGAEQRPGRRRGRAVAWMQKGAEQWLGCRKGQSSGLDAEGAEQRPGCKKGAEQRPGRRRGRATVRHIVAVRADEPRTAKSVVFAGPPCLQMSGLIFALP